MNWLCKLIGHKHKAGNMSAVWWHGEYCLRCNAAKASVEGDGCVRCTIFGHHHHANIVGDDGGYTITSAFCQRCHATPRSCLKTRAV